MLQLFPRKRIIYTTTFSIEEIKERLNQTINFTKEKNFFNSTTSDSLYSGVVHTNSFILRKKSFTRKPFGSPKIIGKLIETNNNNIIEVLIKPSAVRIAISILFYLFPTVLFMIINRQLLFEGLIFITLAWGVIGYIIAILGFNFDISQIELFFERKIIN